MRLLPLLIPVVLTLASPLALAAAGPYGKYFVEAERVWPDETSPDPNTPASISSDKQSTALVRALSERLIEQEYRDGPYAMSLAETLDSLARAQEAMGDIAAARKSRARALHLIRLNEGLYSVAQRPVLRAMLDSLRREGDFTALDERYNYFFRLYGSGRPPWDGLRWSATMEYLRWQREVLRRGQDRDLLTRLLDLHEMHEDLLEILVSDERGIDYLRFKDATFSQLKTLYLIEDLVEPQPLYRDRRTGFPSSVDDPRDFSLQQERLENLQRTVRAAGRRLLDDLLAAIPSEELELRAETQLALADWLQWHGAAREARAVYEGIWRDLDAGGLNSLATEWFSKPVPLPDNGVFWESGLEDGDGLFFVRLKVREDGRAIADVAPSGLGRTRSAALLQRYIQTTRFRPAMDDGRITSSENIEARYRLIQR
ncbi:hypothetical protein R0137_12960 [Congregibacter brevis]|uniref:Uncharacterized protein n=1 Tax=Congregibacter brevis TaxID=3081201 RepID=A0ABZ0I9E5_9GAMM|nr:hypothetical protein R0137_12960 [Congregibacter sp. IMCC45268]